STVWFSDQALAAATTARLAWHHRGTKDYSSAASPGKTMARMSCHWPEHLRPGPHPYRFLGISDVCSHEFFNWLGANLMGEEKNFSSELSTRIEEQYFKVDDEQSLDNKENQIKGLMKPLLDRSISPIRPGEEKKLKSARESHEPSV
ncbi:hypothetical protein J0S82_018572, partial [Galemys pyrenaicus]